MPFGLPSFFVFHKSFPGIAKELPTARCAKELLPAGAPPGAEKPRLGVMPVGAFSCFTGDYSALGGSASRTRLPSRTSAT